MDKSQFKPNEHRWLYCSSVKETGITLTMPLLKRCPKSRLSIRASATSVTCSNINRKLSMKKLKMGCWSKDDIYMQKKEDTMNSSRHSKIASWAISCATTSSGSDKPLCFCKHVDAKSNRYLKRLKAFYWNQETIRTCNRLWTVNMKSWKCILCFFQVQGLMTHKGQNMNEIKKDKKGCEHTELTVDQRISPSTWFFLCLHLHRGTIL